MNGDTPELRQFARGLFAHNLADGQPACTKNAETFRLCEKLRGPLSQLTGLGGFRSLLSRALALSGQEIPWLRALHINADGSLEGLEKLEQKLDSHTIAEGEILLVSHLLGLLLTFIGAALTAGLLRELWPKMVVMGPPPNSLRPLDLRPAGPDRPHQTGRPRPQDQKSRTIAVSPPRCGLD